MGPLEEQMSWKELRAPWASPNVTPEERVSGFVITSIMIFLESAVLTLGLDNSKVCSNQGLQIVKTTVGVDFDFPGGRLRFAEKEELHSDELAWVKR